jgi:hypothetical protein
MVVLFSFVFFMNPRSFSKSWNVLCWNIRGINAENKWESLKNKILESQCDFICIQETKKESFDLPFIKLLCPPPLIAYASSHPLGLANCLERYFFLSGV